MNALKRILGLFWMLLAPSAVVFMFIQAIDKTYDAAEGIARTNTALQWGIILFIFIPICTGLAIFGYYSLKGEYDERTDNGQLDSGQLDGTTLEN